MRRSLPIWVLPIVFLVIGFGSGFTLARFDLGADSPLDFLTYGGDAAAARSLLSNVLTGIVSITTLTLTITIVTLQLASSQYSPRLMKRYLRDRSIQVAVSFFFFVFAFTLPVLFHVRSGEQSSDRFVPDLALTAVIVLAVLMLVGLVYFVFHVTRSVRVENILEDIATGTSRVLADRPQLGTEPDLPTIPDGAKPVIARRSGFLIAVDVAALGAALPSDDQLWLDDGIGDYVIAGVPIAWYVGSLPIDDLAALIDDLIDVASERDESSEFAFGLRQIVDIGVRALSPGVNDPTTAVVSVDVATRALVDAAGVGKSIDEPAHARVHLPRPTWTELVFSTFDQYATYGCGDAQVVRSIVRSLRRLVGLAPEHASTERLAETIDSVRSHLAASDLAESERGTISRSLDDCEALLDRHPARSDPDIRTAQRVV